MLTVLLGALLACSGDTTIETMKAPGPPAPPRPPPTLDVRATSPQAGWLARTVGGVRVTVSEVLPAGEDAATWRPDPEVIADMSKADLVVANGAGFEGWMATATLPDGKVVYTANGVEDLLTIADTTHSHGGDEAHSHTGTDPHTWGDPLTFLTQARVLRDALNRAAPDQQDYFNERLIIVEEDLRALDESYEAAMAGAATQPMASNHPSFNYLARRYGLTITSFDFDPSSAPEPSQLAAFKQWAAGQTQAPILLWEAAPGEAALAAFPARVKHLYLDPLERGVDGKLFDYLVQANANISRFKKAL